MKDSNIWVQARQAEISVSPDINGGFDIGFDPRIPEETKNELRSFISWVEDNFNLPVTLWVDFEYRHYLLDRSRKKMGYLFYWADFSHYPVFDNIEDIPVIRLPVRTEHYTMEEILASFIEAISSYFAWILNIIPDGYHPDSDDTEEILQEYLRQKGSEKEQK